MLDMSFMICGLDELRVNHRMPLPLSGLTGFDGKYCANFSIKFDLLVISYAETEVEWEQVHSCGGVA